MGNLESMVILPSGSVPENPAQPHFDTLREGVSMHDLYILERGHAFNGSYWGKAKNRGLVCGTNQTKLYLEQTYGAVERALKYYENDGQNITETAFALTFLKGVDDKHEMKLQKSTLIQPMLKKFCDDVGDGQLREVCNTFTSSWKPGPLKWKAEGAIRKHLSASSNEKVGKEKDFMWGKLNGQCQLAITARCEIPYVCERTFFDPIPRSQYFLTHQLFQRILVGQMNCPTGKGVVDENVNEKLCAKMYQEAELISEMGFPIVMRDIFSEYVALCGYMGYPNFIREDWLQKILSWQSESDYGCFIRDKGVTNSIGLSDIATRRPETEEETAKGVLSEEVCLSHFTAVGVAAVAMNLDYIEDHCK